MKAMQLCLGCLMILSTVISCADSSKTMPVYIGGYNDQGIFKGQFDTETGAIAGLEVAAETQNPSYLILHPQNNHLYCVAEGGE